VANSNGRAKTSSNKRPRSIAASLNKSSENNNVSQQQEDQTKNDPFNNSHQSNEVFLLVLLRKYVENIKVNNDFSPLKNKPKTSSSSQLQNASLINKRNSMFVLLFI
jgi:hypothetical protein